MPCCCSLCSDTHKTPKTLGKMKPLFLLSGIKQKRCRSRCVIKLRCLSAICLCCKLQAKTHEIILKINAGFYSWRNSFLFCTLKSWWEKLGMYYVFFFAWMCDKSKDFIEVFLHLDWSPAFLTSDDFIRSNEIIRTKWPIY